jgi:hypothetical protein
MEQSKNQGLCAQTCSVELGSARQTPRCQFVIVKNGFLLTHTWRQCRAVPHYLIIWRQCRSGSAAKHWQPAAATYLWRQCRLAITNLAAVPHAKRSIWPNRHIRNHVSSLLYLRSSILAVLWHSEIFMTFTNISILTLFYDLKCRLDLYMP